MYDKARGNIKERKRKNFLLLPIVAHLRRGNRGLCSIIRRGTLHNGDPFVMGRVLAGREKIIMGRFRTNRISPPHES